MMRAAKAETSAEKTAANGRLEVISFAVRCQGDADFPLYWVKFDPLKTSRDSLIDCLTQVLVDPVFQTGIEFSAANIADLFDQFSALGFYWFAQKQFLPGVTDNLAHTIEEALKLKGVHESIRVASGSAHLIKGAGTLKADDQHDLAALIERAQYRLFHPLIEKLHIVRIDGKIDQSVDSILLGFPDVVPSQTRAPEIVRLDGLTDAELAKLSSDRLLALSVDEMKAIRSHFASPAVQSLRKKAKLSPEPTDVELEIIAQTWSEHCKHKIFNAVIHYSDGAPGANDRSQPVKIDSLYKTFIKGATKALKERRPDLLSVFEDNSGVVQWDDQWAVCFKVETHNSPSALEPYGGALTGILGVNRDILGTGLGARPIFNTDIFCFAHPSSNNLVNRPKMLPPGAIPTGVRRGVQDGGNKSGIPTVNGAIFFHDAYRSKPLVFCGTGGLLPISRDGLKMYEKHTRPGDRVVMVGGRVGKDGIHGATFSSESLHEGSPVTAVQIGDPFTQKRVIDFILAARDKGLLTGITDNGAGGLSSSVGEMAGQTGGATIELSSVPLKYSGLEDWQIVVSESQERMTVSTRNFETLQKLALDYSVEVSDIGEFNDRGHFEVLRDGKTVALLDLDFLHNGVPRMNLSAYWHSSDKASEKEPTQSLPAATPSNLQSWLLSLLAHANICSREYVIRQYDHEVQGRSVIKPLMGSEQTAPCDAAVLKPIYGQKKGLVVSNGLCPQWSEHDPYLMAISAVDEAVRNAVCVGADPDTISLLDNFCWPDPIKSARNADGEYKLGQLVRTCQGLYAACLAYGTPLISGKDSMKNDFDDGVVRLSIPPTLLVSAMGSTPDCLKCLSMEFKNEGDLIYLLSAGSLALSGSHLHGSMLDKLDAGLPYELPSLDLPAAAQMYRKLHNAIQLGLVNSAHDLSEGGLAVALAECCFGGSRGARIQLDNIIKKLTLSAPDHRRADQELNILKALFGEGPGHLLISVPADKREQWESLWPDDLTCHELGTVSGTGTLNIAAAASLLIDLPVAELRKAWNAQLPFDEGEFHYV